LIDVEDEAGQDPKLIAVPIHEVDPRWDEYKCISDIPKHIQEELSVFFKEYKKLESHKYDKVIVYGFKDKDDAYNTVNKAIERFHENHTQK
jgi:inorganic pyrophosphatase